MVTSRTMCYGKQPLMYYVLWKAAINVIWIVRLAGLAPPSSNPVADLGGVHGTPILALVVINIVEIC